MITFASSHTSRSEPTVFAAPPVRWESYNNVIIYPTVIDCLVKESWWQNELFFLPATVATSTRKVTERFMLVGGWGRLLWKRTSRGPDQGRGQGGSRVLKKFDMNSAQVFTLGFFAIHKSSILSTTPSNKNCQSLSSTSVKSGCMDDKKKPNQIFLKTVIRYMFGAIF